MLSLSSVSSLLQAFAAEAATQIYHVTIFWFVLFVSLILSSLLLSGITSLFNLLVLQLSSNTTVEEAIAKVLGTFAGNMVAAWEEGWTSARRDCAKKGIDGSVVQECERGEGEGGVCGRETEEDSRAEKRDEEGGELVENHWDDGGDGERC